MAGKKNLGKNVPARMPCLSEIKEALYWAAVGAGAQLLAVTLRSVLQSPIGRFAK